MSQSTRPQKQTDASKSKKNDFSKDGKETSKNKQFKPKHKDKKKISQDEIRKIIYTRISDAYFSEKGQRFIVHLIKSFFPAEKTNHAFQRSSEKMVCCITNKELMTYNELKEIISSQPLEEVNSYVMKKLTFWQRLGDVNWEFHPFDKLLGGKYLALKSEQSDKFLCEMAWQELRRFILNQIEKGDQKIVGLIVERKPKKKPLNTMSHINPKAATQSLGDNDVLKKLNEKLNQK